MFFLSLETSTVAFRTVLDELLCFFLALNLTSFQYFCQESFFFAFLFAFQRKFGPKIPAKIPRNRPFSPRICLFKSREISLFSPRIIRSPVYCIKSKGFFELSPNTLRMVPPFVAVHMFCASWDIGVSNIGNLPTNTTIFLCGLRLRGKSRS